MRTLPVAATALALLLPLTATAQDGRAPLTLDDVTAGAQTQLLPNAGFLPPEAAGEAAPFEGRLVVSESEMATDVEEWTSREIFGGEPAIFPAFEIDFTTVDGHLVPATQDVIRAGSIHAGDSFWDVIVQPGRVWTEEGDDGWSRASFPFSLVHSLEGETHNGVVMFFYRDGDVTGLRYQVLTQTAPFYVVDYFTASGVSDLAVEGFEGDAAAIAETFTAAQADAVEIAPWSELEAQFGAEALAGFNDAIDVEEDLIAEGILVDGTYYLKSCPTPMGPLPYCDAQRFGVWSVTKSASNAVALFALAQDYGIEILDERLVDYIPALAEDDGWDEITFDNAINMATGMGYPEGGYGQWYPSFYEALSADDKVAGIMEATQVVAEPGSTFSYRDESMFLVGLAMTRYLEAQGSPYETVWDYLEAEVYAPIGIHYAPVNKTIEADGSPEQPLGAFGLYATLSDLARIAELYQAGGAWEGEQLLHPDLVAEVFSREPQGLGTHEENRPTYSRSFWRTNVTEDIADCAFSMPMMTGWGRNFVMMFPNDTTVIRLAKDWDGDVEANATAPLAATAVKLGDVCE